MKCLASGVIFDNSIQYSNSYVEIESPYLNSHESHILFDDCYAYPALINSHDHLIGNWYPRAGDTDLYPNAHVWVKDMRESSSVQERNRIWVNTLPMNFLKGNGKVLALLGCYKNIFSGVSVIQDHSPNQQKEYYDLFPVNVIQNYRQCHSLALGNFWGGEDPVREWELTDNKMPFILHLGEGLDEVVKKEFQELKDLNLLQANTLLIHGIALTASEIKMCADRDTSICWCPFSNNFLIGKSLDIKSCLEYGVNVVIGTDSTLSGSINLFDELRFAKKSYPYVSSKDMFKMVTQNARKALFLSEENGRLSENGNQSILFIKRKVSDAFDNLIMSQTDDIIFLMYKGRPIFGQTKILQHFDINSNNYYFYQKEKDEYFVIGHPNELMNYIGRLLGYKKELPYLPF